MEYELAKDGVTGNFENRIIPIGNDEVLSFVRDITESKMAEEALRKSEETFRILNVLTAKMLEQPDLESLYRCIANSLYDRFEDTIVFYNSIANEKDESILEAIIGIENSLIAKFTGMLGYNPVGKKFKILPDYYEIIKHGKLVEFTNGLGKFAGGTLPDVLAWTIEKMVGIHKIYTIGIWKDQELLGAIHFMTFNKKTINDASFIETFANQAGIVIQKKIAEQNLIGNESQLKELNVTKDKFFSIIAHDLKSPFNSILGFSELLIRQIQEDDYEGIERYAEIIEGSSQHAMALLTNLLEWSRSQTSRMEFNPEYVEVVSLLREVSDLFDDAARHKKIVITKELPKSVIVHADKSMISTVFRNLLSNAVKFTRKKGKITISAIEGADEWTFRVSDNGVGIRNDLVEKIFRIDSNHSTLGTNNEKGTGLGLVLCSEFVEKHGGRIWVEREPEIGSNFYFTIPKT
jgi:signal transduction histidine kinase